MKPRLYDEKVLKSLYDSGYEGRENLLSKLESEKTMNVPDDRTQEEKDKNIDMIEFALNGGVRNTRKDILEDIKAGLPDDIDKGE
jgi:hypothetical protein